MIVFALFSILVIIYRLRRRLITSTEWCVFAIVAIGYLAILLQSCFAFGHFHWQLPEGRYVIQLTGLLYGWGAWGILQLSGRMKRMVSIAIIAALACYHSVMMIKSHVPFGRRSAFVAASEWAVDRIRADYHGPSRDAKNAYSDNEYHRPNRPVVHGFNPRIGYFLGGRDESLSIFGAADQPDYWVTGHFDDAFEPTKYEFVERLVIGKREFCLYRRKNNDGK